MTTRQYLVLLRGINVGGLWAVGRQSSALADPYAGDRVIQITSRSKPGVVYEVRIAGGVVTCTCPSFTYRGNCAHARDAASYR